MSGRTTAPADGAGRAELQAAPVLLLGADGAAGREALVALLEGGASVIAVSRRVPDFGRPNLTWLQYDLARETARVQAPVMVCASAGALPGAARQARAMPSLRRIVAVASAAVRFDRHSREADRRRKADDMARAEEQLQDLCLRRDITLTLLRPTQVYGGADGSRFDEVERWIERRGWFPIAGNGLRQPVHAGDLAALLVRLAGRPEAGVFELGGGETLAYPDFVRRIASAHGRRLRTVRVPAALLDPLVRILSAPRPRPGMAGRQNMDRVVDDTGARQALGWNPRPFRP